MIRWLCFVWPPWWAVLPAVLICGAADALVLYFNSKLGMQFLSAEDERPLLAIRGFIACLYALYRIGAFHPALRPEYCQWLRGTPWTVGKQLPLGPVLLVWQDMLILIVAVGLGWPTLHSRSLVMIAAFFFFYLLIMGAMNFVTGAKLWACALGFGIGIMILAVHSYLAFVFVTLVCYLLAYKGLQAALARFPWEGSVVGDILDTKKITGQHKDLGWPYRQLGPPGLPDFPPIARGDALAIGAIGAWWFFVVGHHCRLQYGNDAEILLVFVVIALIGAPVRLLYYCYGYVPPLSLMGRLALARPIIPGYDQVFIAPLLVVTVTAAAYLIALWSGLDRLVVASVAVGLSWWILLGMGPSLQTWRLTGNHRISPGVPTNQFVK
jgi:hypothetical protein